MTNCVWNKGYSINLAWTGEPLEMPYHMQRSMTRMIQNIPPKLKFHVGEESPPPNTPLRREQRGNIRFKAPTKTKSSKQLTNYAIIAFYSWMENCWNLVLNH